MPEPLRSDNKVRIERLFRYLVYASVLVAPLHVYRRPLGPLNASLFRVCVLGLGIIVLVGVVRRRQDLLAAARRLRWALLAIAAFLVLEVVQSRRNVAGVGDTILGQRVVFFASVVIVAGAVILLRVPRVSLRRAFLASAAAPYVLAVEQWARGTADQALPLEGLIGDRGGLDLLRSGGYSSTGLRPAATFSDPNFLGVFSAVTFILADQHRREADGKERLMAIGFQAASLVVLGLCASRTGLVAVVTYTAFRVLRAAGRHWRDPRVAIVAALVGVALVASISVVSVLGRANSGVSSERHIETRLTAIGVGGAHPVAGVGLGNLGPLLAQPSDRSSAHALPFTILAEEGLLGLFLCGAALAIPLVRTVRMGLDTGEAGLAVGLAAAVWFYDFPFALDVAALWWALLMVSASQDLTSEASVERASERRASTNARYTAAAPSIAASARPTDGS